MLRFRARWPLVFVAVTVVISAIACGDLTSTVPIWGHPFEREQTPQPGGVVPEPEPSVEPDVALDHDVTDWGSISGADLLCFSASREREVFHIAVALPSEQLRLAIEFVAPYEASWQVDPGLVLGKTACISGEEDFSFVMSNFNLQLSATELHAFDSEGFLTRNAQFPFRPGWEAFFPYQAARTETDIFFAGNYLDAGEPDTFDVFRYSIATGGLGSTSLFPFSTTRFLGLAATDDFLFILSETDAFGSPSIQIDRRPVGNISNASFISTQIEDVDSTGSRTPEGNRMLALGDGTIVFATEGAVHWREADLTPIRRWPTRNGEQIVALAHDASSNLLYAAVTTPTQSLVRYFSFDGPTGVAYREQGAGIFARGISDIRGRGVIFIAADRAIGNEDERATYTMSQISLR